MRYSIRFNVSLIDTCLILVLAAAVSVGPKDRGKNTVFGYLKTAGSAVCNRGRKQFLGLFFFDTIFNFT